MQTEWVHWNPGASQPLRVPLEVDCNTPTETILDNIQSNAKGRKGWLKLAEAHGRKAILCGSGPSLGDTLGEIQDMQGDIFALNGAAKFLHEHGIMPDYQVLLDAQPKTADLIGPAKQYLFASQVDPECFKRKPEAILWHSTHGKIVPDFPEYDDDYCLIGGAVTVGNAALALVFAMGYREIHCFGYDSSHRDGKGHAFHQAMNEGDPTTIVEYEGKEYIASLTMRLQTHYFLDRAALLEHEGVKLEVHGTGLLPAMFKKRSEQEKYRLMWSLPEYRECSPGERVAEAFVKLAGIKPADTVIDFGCGTGRGGKRIAELTGAEVILLDFVENSRDEDVRLPFFVADLTKPIPFKSDFGFCTDVMEHIPTEDVPVVLDNIAASTKRVFFQVSLIFDNFGGMIGHALHLTVKPFEWWVEQMSRIGKITYSENLGDEARFYIETNP